MFLGGFTKKQYMERLSKMRWGVGGGVGLGQFVDLSGALARKRG